MNKTKSICIALVTQQIKPQSREKRKEGVGVGNRYWVFILCTLTADPPCSRGDTTGQTGRRSVVVFDNNKKTSRIKNINSRLKDMRISGLS